MAPRCGCCISKTTARGDDSICISVPASTALTLVDVTVIGGGGAAPSFGIQVAGTGAMASLTRATVIGGSSNFSSGIHVFSDGVVDLNQVTAISEGGAASHGLFLGIGETQSPDATVKSSVLHGASHSVQIAGGAVNASAKIAISLIDGAVAAGLTCIGSFDETFAALDASCN